MRWLHRDPAHSRLSIGRIVQNLGRIGQRSHRAETLDLVMEEITMKHITIGGLDVSRIGLGAMSMSGYYNIGEVATRSRLALFTGPWTWASPTSTPPRSTAPFTTRSSSAGRSRVGATRW